jgi:hypothetical protein
MTKAKKENRICRSFRQDFPQFVERAEALGVRIDVSGGRRRPGQDRVFWLDGYRQLTGYTTRADGMPFTLEDAAKNIDKILTQIEEDRAVAAELSIPERFARVMEEFRKIKPRDGMIGEVRIPNGDRGHCFFMANYDGGVHLEGVGEVAEARAPWRRDESYEGHLARFCDALEADFEWRLEVRTE